ncbi:MAG: SpoIIE family protein phosphatase [Clostridia bacterium]|nr:SpoIIE family protein phosphatase [Clostridia bacterium]
MKFFESRLRQETKSGYIVCGDTMRCERDNEHTILVLCDGIGSGIYANIAAITCAERLMELFRTGLSFRDACCTVADSMHRARTEPMPFTAFSAVKVLVNGSFTVYTYEAPAPLLLRENKAEVMEQRFLTAGYEVVGESEGKLFFGDSLLLCSDGVSQAGLGNGYSFGIKSEGLAKFINGQLRKDGDLDQLLASICAMTYEISGGRHADDTSLAMLTAREAKELTIATGPPSSRRWDSEFVSRFMSSPGLHVVCGSTTTNIVARELNRPVEYVNKGAAFGAPPEYRIEGVDMATEGAMMLSQVYNILDEAPENLYPKSPVERLSGFIHDADIINIIFGRSVNEAHSDLIFKQIGVRSRQTTVNLLKEKLEDMGKLVVIESF